MSSGNEVKVVILWDTLLKQSPVYGSAFDIFSGKAHKAPNIDTKRTLLMNIISRPWEEYFIRGSRQANDFQRLKKLCYARWLSVSAHLRIWTVPYTAKKLAPLLVLCNQVDSKKKVGASPCIGAATPQMNNLKRAFRDLFDAYNTSLASYVKMKQADANKSVRLSSLNRQLTGPLLQYNHAWSQRKKDADGCPCCLHVSMMAVKLQADVNSKNCKLRTKASAGGGDGKFVAISALHSCYCLLNNCRGHQGGYGCFDCIRKAVDGKTPVEQRPGRI
jgi:hypothetical protein